MPVYERELFLEILRHHDERIIDGAVAVRMIFTHCIADDTRTLTVRPVIADAEFIHVIERTPLHRLEAVPDVRQCTGNDNAHRIVDIGLLHYLRIFCLNNMILICHLHPP